MPTYQYACKEPACGHRFEAVQSFSDDPLTACPVCEGQVRKVFSAVGVVFKGSGFYRTDSREPVKSAAKNGSAKDDKASPGTGSSSDSGSDSGAKKAESTSASSSSGSGSGSSGSPSGSTSSAAAS